MIKQALCINKAQAYISGIFLDKFKHYVYPMYDSIYGLQTKLIDRTICETDPDTLQLLPYIVVQRGDFKIFTYTRGKAGTEDRLHSLMSIGLGGHVDSAAIDGEPETLVTLLQLEAVRELQEEVGLQADPHKIVFQGLIYDGSTDVGKVHLGLFAWYKLDELEVKQEAGNIEDGQWLSIDELLKPEVYGKLENWSKAIMDHILDELASEAAVFGE